MNTLKCYENYIPDQVKEILNYISLKDPYHPYLVGGCVRDMCLGISCEDYDIEVFNTQGYDELLNYLSVKYQCFTVGKSFGVIKLSHKGFHLDISIPRVDIKKEDGESDESGRGFEVQLKPNMLPIDACARRDFTINAMMICGKSYTLLDFYTGVYDLSKKILRATTKQFKEDPLRVLRGFQFASRFGFDVDDYTAEMCKQMIGEPLVKERIYGEWWKFFTLCKFPRKGIEFLIKTEWINKYPELKALISLPQEPEWHPEGDVMEHTLCALDALMERCDFTKYDLKWKAVVVAAVLLHDVGKATTTAHSFNKTIGKFQWRSLRHSSEGVPIASKFLSRIGFSDDFKDHVLPLIKEHMRVINFSLKTGTATMRDLSVKMHPATLAQLYQVCNSDSYGRGTKSSPLEEEAEAVFEIARKEGIWDCKAENIIKGRDILQHFNCATPKHNILLGDALKYVYKLYLDNRVNSKEQAVQRALDYVKHSARLVRGDDIQFMGLVGSDIKVMLDKSWDIQVANPSFSKEEILAKLSM